MEPGLCLFYNLITATFGVLLNYFSTVKYKCIVIKMQIKLVNQTNGINAIVVNAQID